MHEKGLAQFLAPRECTKTLAFLIISIVSQRERVTIKCNKISEVLERQVAMASIVQNTYFF